LTAVPHVLAINVSLRIKSPLLGCVLAGLPENVARDEQTDLHGKTFAAMDFRSGSLVESSFRR
jgi:hypothetical protein